MSVVDWDNVTAITRSKILPKLVDNISKSHILLNRMLRNPIKADGGKRIEKVIRYALSTQGGWYSGLDTLDTARETTRTRAYWEWRQAHQPIVISNIDIAKNGGTSKVLGLVAEEMADAEVSLRDKFSTALFGAQTGKRMEGLVDAVDDGTNVATYGNINRSTYSWWQGYYNGSGGALALATMRTAWDAVASGSDTPTVIPTTEAMFSAYEALLQANARYEFTTKGYPLADGAFKSLMFRGAPVVSDEYCTSGYMYFLNEKYLDFITLKHPKHATDKMGFTMSPMKEPTNQDGQIGQILWYGNFINTQPRRSGVVRGLS